MNIDVPGNWFITINAVIAEEGRRHIAHNYTRGDTITLYGRVRNVNELGAVILEESVAQLPLNAVIVSLADVKE